MKWLIASVVIAIAVAGLACNGGGDGNGANGDGTAIGDGTAVSGNGDGTAIGGDPTTTGNDDPTAITGRPLTLEEYFREVERLDQRSEDDSALYEQVLRGIFLAGEEPSERQRDAIAYVYGELRRVFVEFVRAFEGLDPPEEAEAVHARTIEVLGEITDDFDGFIATIQATEPEDVERVINETLPSFQEAGNRANMACVEMVELAAEHGVEIDLGCR
jgi:hypothetical protein